MCPRCNVYGRLKLVHVCETYTERVVVLTSSSTRRIFPHLLSCAPLSLSLQPCLQPPQRDMPRKRKHHPRDVQPIPRRITRRMAKAVAAAAAAISAANAVAISDNVKDNDQSNPDRVASTIRTPRSPMVRHTTTYFMGRKRGKRREQKTKSVAVL